MPEHLRRTLSRALALAAAALLLAGSARAGAFASPFSYPCAAATVDAVFPDTNVFVGVGDTDLCVKLCKGAIKECRSWGKAAYKCAGRLYADASTYQNANCRVLYSTGELLKACQADVKEAKALAKITVRNGLLDFLGDCETWSADCQAECTAQ